MIINWQADIVNYQLSIKYYYLAENFKKPYIFKKNL